MLSWHSNRGNKLLSYFLLPKQNKLCFTFFHQSQYSKQEEGEEDDSSFFSPPLSLLILAAHDVEMMKWNSKVSYWFERAQSTKFVIALTLQQHTSLWRLTKTWCLDYDEWTMMQYGLRWNVDKEDGMTLCSLWASSRHKSLFNSALYFSIVRT